MIFKYFILVDFISASKAILINNQFTCNYTDYMSECKAKGGGILKLGQKIAILRKEKGLTQVEFAKEFNIDKSTVAKYETDKILPSIPMLIRLAKFFQVSADFLLGLED